MDYDTNNTTELIETLEQYIDCLDYIICEDIDKHDKYIKKLRKKLNKLKEKDRGDID